MRTLIAGGDLITMSADRTVRTDGAVLIDGTRISAVGPRSEVEASLDRPVDRVVDARGGVIMPGLVDVHVHLVESLMRHSGDDVDLATWVRSRLRPYEESLNAELATAAAQLALLELTLAGVTTVGESMLPAGAISRAVATAAADSGLRVLLAIAVGGPHDGDGMGGFESMRDEWDEHEGRIAVWLAPRPLPQSTPQFLKSLGSYSRTENSSISWHFANSESQYRWITEQFGTSPARVAADLGLLRPGVLLGHCTWLGEGDIDVISRSGASVAHLPRTNLRLGMGVMPLVALRAAGVPVGLGTDGDNSHDLLDVARLAGHVQSLASGPSAISAWAALELLTIEGATALGLRSEIGSLEVGKRADVIVVSTDGPHMFPKRDPTAMVAQSAKASDIRTSFVDGNVVLDDGVPTRVDAAAILARATVPSHSRSSSHQARATNERYS
ncbi:hypothetical protein CH272_28005 [Rhodococcus sp. 05-340-1]|uniref:amidohydrolase family protein n=1 Tax=unclassified Rhodococcus (in: high G+C Gram-positive bacteria) TaxID=192944 RepID=UPI000B9C49A3|nr:MULTISPECIES: amidohydrolase family protein [unclassified Rhodococcus (in: high G+C Gram-positive bacteria)]OZD68859.1 hypothetical protein CH271_10725 [Rhodococcus sp. 05-340-2]OZD69332.1 hypothetical protein CH272_28005 [Rhodococcus sp. 05-340-1]